MKELTNRQLEVLQLLSEGLVREDIGKKLFIGVGTVRNHITGIMGSLEASNRAHAVAIALRKGLIT